MLLEDAADGGVVLLDGAVAARVLRGGEAGGGIAATRRPGVGFAAEMREWVVAEALGARGAEGVEIDLGDDDLLAGPGSAWARMRPSKSTTMLPPGQENGP